MKNKSLKNTITAGALCAALIVLAFAQDISYSPVNLPEAGPEQLQPAGEDTGAQDALSGVIKPEIAEKLIKETADKVIGAISGKNAEVLSEYAHPGKGVRFTPYTTVSVEKDVVFDKERLKTFFKDQKDYLWGHYDGTGENISLSPAEYYEKFIYSEDFANAKEIGYNKVLSSGNMLENQFEVYDNAIIVEYYFPGFNPDYAGMDWKSLRLVFQQYGDEWKLTGIIHNQWTI